MEGSLLRSPQRVLFSEKRGEMWLGKKQGAQTRRRLYEGDSKWDFS